MNGRTRKYTYWMIAMMIIVPSAFLALAGCAPASGTRVDEQESINVAHVQVDGYEVTCVHWTYHHDSISCDWANKKETK